MTLNKVLEEASGKVLTDSRLVSFFYLLMRDEVTAGVVQRILLEVADIDEMAFSNGWLAEYAKFVAERLHGG